MDTNQKQPIQTNTFGKGMNTDTSDALLGSDQYRLARNLRYTTNTEENTGELHMIDGVKLINTGNILSDQTIIKTAELRDLGIIISSGSSGWNVYTFHKNEPNNLKLVFGPCTESIGENISVVAKYESEEVQKLYIADGIHSIMQIQLVLQEEEPIPTNIDSIISTPQIQLKAPKFCGLTHGQLKSGLVQYSYKLYKKYGQTSEISPTTKLIQIINDDTIDLSNDKKIKGGEYGKICNCGVKINIDITNDDKQRYDFIIIYRIHYDQAGQNPTIENIADIKLDNLNNGFIDYGTSSNEILTLEEYNSNSGIHIIPAIIESKDDYLFAARIKSIENTLESEELKNYDARAFSFNQYGKCKVYNNEGDSTDITDETNWLIDLNKIPNLTHDCINPRNDMNIDPDSLIDNNPNSGPNNDKNYIYKGLDPNNNKIIGGVGTNIEWEFVTGNIIVDANDKTPRITSNTTFEDGERIDPYKIGNDNDWWKHYVSSNADKGELQNYMYGYANPYTSYLMKSLRRNELYRFGIIFYDKYGTASSVKWIADIRTPDIIENSPFSHGVRESFGDLRAHPLGIKFIIKNYPEGTVSYEIVRCNRQISDILNLQQGVLSRPQQKVYMQNSTEVKQDTLTPTGFLTTTNYAIGLSADSPRSNYHHDGSSYDTTQYSDNFANNDIFQFVSAEALYNQDSILQINNLKLDALKYIFPVNYHNDSITNKDAFGMGLNCYSQNHREYGRNATMYNAYFVDNSPYNIYQHYGISFYTGNDEMYGCYYKDKTNDQYKWRYLSVDSILNYNYNTNDSDKNWFDFVNNHYIYQKLYNFAYNNVVYCQPHRNGLKHQPEYMQEIDTATIKYASFDVGDIQCHLPVAVRLNAKHLDYNVDEVVKANKLKWNDLGKTTDPQDTDNLQFVGQIINIHGKSYCNFVSGPLYDSSLTLNQLKKSNNDPKNNDKRFTTPIGPAGRCLLLQIQNHENTVIPVRFQSSTPTPEKVNRLLDTIAASYAYARDGEAPDENSEDSTYIYYYVDGSSTDERELIYRSQMMGTYICNLKHSVTPYGGNTYNDRQNNIYYSYGDIYDIATNSSSTAIVFNGDTFLSPIEYVSMHKCYNANIINTLNACIIQSIPLETSINVAMTYGNEFSRNNDSQSIVNLQIEPSNVYNKYIQSDPLYVYNTVYSASSLARMYSTIDYDIYTDSINNKDYRCYYSAPKGNNELQDSWLKFQPNNYIDVDTRYGAITQLRTFHNSLIYWQENATGLFSVNERTAITDDSNLPLILGTGGILSRYDYIATSNGMSKDDFSDAQSESTLYWWDRNRNEICVYAGGQQIQQVSKTKNVQNYLNKIQVPDEKPCLLHDKKYNEIIMHVSDDGIDESLVYSEYVAAFTSLYDIAFNNKIEFSDRTYVTKDNHLFELNKFVNENKNSYGTYMVNGLQVAILPYLKYVVNENPQIVKTFDNVTFGGRVYGGEVEDVNHLSFTFSTPLKQHSTTGSNVITNREYDFKFAIPRNEAREPEESDQQWRSKFEERMKGKTMQCELLSDSNSTDFSLQYITTKFRQSWS